MLQFNHAKFLSSSSIEQILADSEVNKSNKNLLKSSNLDVSTPPFTIKSRPSGLLFIFINFFGRLKSTLLAYAEAKKNQKKLHKNEWLGT